MWISIRQQLPPEDVIVETKIDDKDGLRNIQDLQRRKNLWWHADGKTYVYYIPTHWKYKT